MEDVLLNLTKEVASVTAGFKLHLDECGRRYQESADRTEKLIAYVKETKNETQAKVEASAAAINTQIATLVTAINQNNIVQAERRGAGRMAKTIWGIVIAVGTIGGGFIGNAAYDAVKKSSPPPAIEEHHP